MLLQRPKDNRGMGAPENVRLLIRENGTVTAAGEWYYHFVKSNSGMSFCDLILPEDGEILRKKLHMLAEWASVMKPEDGSLELEFITTLENRLGESYSDVYVRLEGSRQTEQGEPLFQIVLTDLLEMQEETNQRMALLAKYRFFMTLKNEMYFEYRPSDNNFVLYKYVNGRSFKMVDDDLDRYIAEVQEPYTRHSEAFRSQLETMVSYLKGRESSFELSVSYPQEDGSRTSGRFYGGLPDRNPDMVAGIYLSDETEQSTAYYLTPAARDPGTGLLNKRAVTEYVMEKLPMIPAGSIAWLVILDIDDFKHINDNFGHIFGDEVIRYVADTLQTEIGTRGFVGRFGGDEFFAFLDRVPTRDDLKTLLKTITKQFLLKFDPKFTLTASIGISCYPQDGITLEQLFAKADKALYIAKEKGKNRHIIYDEKLHGSLEEESMQSQAVSYAISREKRRRLLGDLVTQISISGAEYITENPAVQNDFRTLFDLDGIMIVTDFGETVLCRNGKYVDTPHLESLFELDPALMERFGDSGRYIENNSRGLKESHPAAFQEFQRVEIGAAIVCAEYVDGRVHTFMTFDIFNKNRKWSDMDIDMLSMIGHTLTRIICAKERQA